MSVPGVPDWIPLPELVDDVHRVLRTIPLEGPEDRFEAQAWDCMLTAIGPRLLTKGHAPSHVTASGFVVDADLQRTCLVLHAKLRTWVQPGGHLERSDRTIGDGAVREVREETGLEVLGTPVTFRLSRHAAPCAPGIVDHHLDVQHIVVCAGTPRVSSESRDVAWWPLDRLPEPLAAGVEASLTDAVARHATPAHHPASDPQPGRHSRAGSTSST